MEAKIDEENWLWVPIIFYYPNTPILFQSNCANILQLQNLSQL
jgi:hypothetical protein